MTLKTHFFPEEVPFPLLFSQYSDHSPLFPHSIFEHLVSIHFLKKNTSGELCMIRLSYLSSSPSACLEQTPGWGRRLEPGSLVIELAVALCDIAEGQIPGRVNVSYHINAILDF